jgi:hypothetical protein
MTVTTKGLTQAAGISAAVAGALFIAVQINHPAMDVSSVTTTEWVVRQSAKTVMAAAALAGITGMYLRQVRQIGILGLVGYLVFGFGYLVMFGVEFAGGYVLPALAHTAPGYVNDVLAAGIGDPVKGNIGAMQTAFSLMGVGYLAGGVLFGIALFRARVLARWASGLLVLGTLATAALHVLPHSFERPLAVPTGVALIGLGISLWRDQRKTAASTADDLVPARVEPPQSDDQPAAGRPAQLPAELAGSGRSGGAEHDSAGSRHAATGAAGRRPAADARRPAVRRLPAPPRPAHHRCLSLRHRGRLPVRAAVPPPPPELAPARRPRPGRGRADGRRFGAVDDAAVRAEARHR